MKNYLWVFLLVGLFLSGCATGERYDLLRLAGQEEECHPVMPKGEMLPFSQVMKRENQFSVVQNPSRRKFLSVGFHELKLTPGDLYQVTLRAVGREGLQIVAFGSEFEEQILRHDRNLLRTTLFLNVNGMTEYRKLFSVSEETTRMIPIITFYSSQGTLGPGTLALLEQLTVERVGTMRKAPEKIRQLNLAEDLDFQKLPLGDFREMHKGNGPDASRWSDVSAEIVEMPEGGKALRVIRKPGDYIYPHFTMKKFPVDPQYHNVRVTFEAKGTGAFRTGLWWARGHMEWDYENAPLCRLTDQWQTFTVVRPCLTPDVTALTFSLNSTDAGTYYLRNFSVHLE